MIVVAINMQKRRIEAEGQLTIDLARRASAANVVTNKAYVITLTDETGAPIVIPKESEAYSTQFPSVTFSRARVSTAIVNPIYDGEESEDSDNDNGYLEVTEPMTEPN